MLFTRAEIAAWAAGAVVSTILLLTMMASMSENRIFSAQIRPLPMNSPVFSSSVVAGAGSRAGGSWVTRSVDEGMTAKVEEKSGEEARIRAKSRHMMKDPGRAFDDAAEAAAESTKSTSSTNNQHQKADAAETETETETERETAATATPTKAATLGNILESAAGEWMAGSIHPDLVDSKLKAGRTGKRLQVTSHLVSMPKREDRRRVFFRLFERDGLTEDARFVPLPGVFQAVDAGNDMPAWARDRLTVAKGPRASEFDELMSTKWSQAFEAKTVNSGEYYRNYGILGCFQSHVKLWRELAEDKAYGDTDVHVVFEDDSVCFSKFDTLARRWMEKELPDDWDIVYFGGVMWREPFEWTKSFARLRMMSNTAHYAIKRSSLPKIISLVVNATDRSPIDVTLTKLTNEGKIAAYSPTRPWCGQVPNDFGGSDIALDMLHRPGLGPVWPPNGSHVILGGGWWGADGDGRSSEICRKERERGVSDCNKFAPVLSTTPRLVLNIDPGDQDPDVGRSRGLDTRRQMRVT